MSKKYTIEFVRNYFKEQGCKLLEKEYVNSKVKMRYKCVCGNISKICFNHFSRGHRCRKCGGCQKYTFEDIKNYFLDNNCELLENEYKNNRYLLKYKCECGNTGTITLDNFKKGKRCKKCGIEKRSGKNSNLWDSNLTDEERIKNKTRTSDFLYIKWRINIYQRDNYTCQKCHQKGTLLNAHHIESWSTNKKLRLVKSNGITFCEKCHKKFHKKYGKKDNNQRQLCEYLKTMTSAA